MSNESRGNAFKVGVLFLIVLALFLGVVIFLGQRQEIFRDMRPITVLFDEGTSVAGLRAGNPVRLQGVSVGSVDRVWLEYTDTAGGDADGTSRHDLGVFVRAEVPTWIELKSDAVITIGTKFVGEDASLEIISPGTSGDAVHEDTIIEGKPAADFATLSAQISEQLDESDPNSMVSLFKSQLMPDDPKSLMGKIHMIADNVNGTVGTLNKELDVDRKAALLAKVHTSMDDINAVTASLRQQTDPTVKGALLHDVNMAMATLQDTLEQLRDAVAENSPVLAQSVKSVQAITADIEQHIMPAVRTELNRDDAASLLAKVHTAVDSGRHSLDNMAAMTDTGRELLTLNRERIDYTVLNMAEGSEHLKAGLKDLRYNPWKLLDKPAPNEKQEITLLDATRAFANAVQRLDTAAARIQAIEQLARDAPEQVDLEQLQTLRSDLDTMLKRLQAAEEAIWEQLQ